MDSYTVRASGAWRRYHPMKVPKGWRMLGTIECNSDHSIGAFGHSPAGLFAQITPDGVRLLDPRAVVDALRRAVPPVTPPPRARNAPSLIGE
jgi:hypothetical protein